MTIARGQMKRQLYADGGAKTLLDLLEPETRRIIEERYFKGAPMPNVYPEEEEIMKRLQRKYDMDPDYQYNEENPYTGPRDMRMGGGIMAIRQPYGFGSFVKSITKPIKKAVSGIGDVISSIDMEDIDKIAQVASFIPGPHQPFAAAYTGARGSGVGGSDFGGFQIGGFTPTGGSFGIGGGQTGGPFSSFMPNAPGTGSPSGNIFGDLNVSDVVRIASQFQDPRQGGGRQPGGDVFGSGQPGGIASIIGKVIQGGISAYGAKKSYDDQKRINEQKQREYDRFIARQEEKRKQYRTGEGLQSLDVRNRTAAAGGGMMELDIRTNPQGVKEIDYREKGGFVPPIGIKEKADDIPAMLSNNEFVFTADAVRAAGGGSVNKGAQKIYALMKQLEAGGKA